MTVYSDNTSSIEKKNKNMSFNIVLPGIAFNLSKFQPSTTNMALVRSLKASDLLTIKTPDILAYSFITVGLRSLIFWLEVKGKLLKRCLKLYDQEINGLDVRESNIVKKNRLVLS